MNTISTTHDYANMKASAKKRLVKEVLKMANKDQQALIKRYEKAVSEKKITPVD